MSSSVNPAQIVQTSNAAESLLETTYYCQLENAKMDVVMQLKGNGKVKQSNIPQRYVLVIDVSRSMASPIHEADNRSLLDRVKFFAKLFIQKLVASNWLSIVMFSYESHILLGMTQMTNQGKAMAIDIIGRLLADGGTNLSDGLFSGLKAAESQQKTYDCIVLFTDGQANNGITDSQQLVQEYKRHMDMQMRNGRLNHVQLAAITIGNYRPDLLVEISKQLSSDAFYWLNYEYDFEADMLIPLFLRERPSISDVSIKLVCSSGVTFVEDSICNTGLQKRIGNSQLIYFIYCLPTDVTKHLSFRLNVANRWKNTDVMLMAHTRYLDHNLVEHKNVDHLYLRTTTMKEVRYPEPWLPEVAFASLDHLEKLTAYVIIRSEVILSWESAQLSFISILNQKCRRCAINAITESSELVGDKRTEDATRCLEEALDYITGIRDHASTVLGRNNLYCKFLSRDLDKLTANLEYGAKNIEKQNWVRLCAVVSSLSTEMPTASGAFDPDKRQPFMPPVVEKQLIEYSQIVHKESKMANKAAKEREINEKLERQNDAYHQILEAAKKRDANAMRTSLQLCHQYGVDEEETGYFDKLLLVVEKEDALLQQIREFTLQENLQKLQETIAVFKTKGSEMVDKTGDVKRGEDAVLQIQAKREMQRLNNALQKEDIQEIVKAINALSDLVIKGAKVDKTVLIQAEADLNELRRQESLRSEMEDLQNQISKSISKEDLPELEKLIEQLSEFLAERGLKTNESHSLFLENSRSVLKTLNQKHDLMNKIKIKWEDFEVPDIPGSLEKLVDDFGMMTALREAALEFEGAFTRNDEERFVEVTRRVEALKEKVAQRNSAEAHLKSAIDARSYNDLVEAIEQAETTSFVSSNLIQEAQVLSNFLNPETRIDALTAAIKAKDIDQLSQAIKDYNDAKVTEGYEVLCKAEKRLEKLIKIKEKEDRRQEKIQKLNNLLLEAMEARDLDRIRGVLHQCEKAKKIESDEIPLYDEAQELVVELIIENLRKSLEDAIENRDLPALKKAVFDVEETGYIDPLADCYYKAKDLIDHLEELQKLKAAIMNMDNSLISEIRGYSKPPVGVVSVMVAVLVMLGEQAKKLENWTEVQKHVGQPIKKRIFRCDPSKLPPKIVHRIKNMLEGLDINQVNETSQGAGSFFAWMQCMIIEADYYFARSN